MNLIAKARLTEYRDFLLKVFAQANISFASMTRCIAIFI